MCISVYFGDFNVYSGVFRCIPVNPMCIPVCISMYCGVYFDVLRCVFRCIMVCILLYIGVLMCISLILMCI